MGSSGSRTIRGTLALVLAIGLLAIAPGAAAGAGVTTVQPQAAQTQPAPDGFEPVTGVPSQEQLPAAQLVMIAYAFVWVMLLFYLWTLWRRLGAVEKELANVTRRVGEGRRS
jgi:CcmD family protein